MPRGVEELRVAEHATQAYILTIDGIPFCWTNDNTGELAGSGASSFIGRAEADLGETVGGREIREGLILPRSLEFGQLEDSLGLGRSTARFSILLDDTTRGYFALSAEEPEEMLGRLAPTMDPAPASIIGVTVRDRYLGLERVGPSGERRMYPYLVGETLQGLDHHGDTDGATVPASVSQRPLVHEGRPVALYRVYRDPSATFASGSLAWPSLSNYSPIWVGKMRDAGTWAAGGRLTIECTGFESLLERNMATGASEPFGVLPEFTAEAGVDDQVAIYLGTGYVLDTTGIVTAAIRFQGRDWTTLAGDVKPDIQAELHTLLQNTVAGTGTDYETGESTMDTVSGADAGVDGNQIRVKMDSNPSGDQYFIRVHVAMHRRRWLALGFDPVQQGVYDGDTVLLARAVDDQKAIAFSRLTSGEPFEPFPGSPVMGAVPGPGYYMAEFHSIPLGATSGLDSVGAWDGNGAWRYFTPLFPQAEPVHIIRADGDQVLRLDSTPGPALFPQSHVPYSGSIDGTDCDSAGYFLIKGKIRKAEGSVEDGSTIIADDTEQAVVARCSWIAADGLFADIGAGVEPALYVVQLYDPRTFGYPFRPLDRDWASLELQCVQLHTFAMGTAASNPERADQTISAFLRSTGTSPGPSGGVIQQGDNSGTAIGTFGDIFAPGMGLAVPDVLAPTQSEITDMMSELPGGVNGDLNRARIAYEGSFSSYDAIRALLEPRGVRVGFDGGRFSLYRLRDASPSDASFAITESDIYGTLGDPTTVYPAQQSRAMAPVDAWTFDYANDQRHEVRAKDPGAGMRRGDNVREINGRGLLAPELYGDDPNSLPVGGHWKNETRILFGHEEARFLGRRHGMVTMSVSRPKGQDIYPGTLITISNPWVYGADGTQGVSAVVGRVVRTSHRLKDGGCDADVLVFEGQWQPPPHFAPALWISNYNSATSLRISTVSDRPASTNRAGWTRPAWSAGAGGNMIVALIRMLPDRTWTVVGTAEFGSISGDIVTLATSLSGAPPAFARTMMLVPDVMANQPAWVQEIYSAVGVQGDNTRTRRFV